MSFDNASNPIEVFIVTNDDGTTNGFAEVTSVTQMLSPYTRINTAQLWNSTPTCYKIQNNGKNFVHAYVVCKYLAAIPETDAQSYKNLRQLVADLTATESKQQHASALDLVPSIAVLEKKIDQLQAHNESMLSNVGALLNVIKSEIICEVNDLLSIVDEQPQVEKNK
ncbi:P24 [Betabaculovirus altermyunipunctae]|uniref:P24 n=1 Tax=Betabaculovirus altermyunipunctae TaxID=3051996 RepID=A0A1S5YDY7_9BBAC|nr:P24 [Betabaculovirus altermyunipunctae]AQQ80339.1 P24 [Betabaculovirus altermyunipunctae]